MKELLVGLLTLGAVSASAQSVSYRSIQEASQDINKIFSKNMAQYAREIRIERDWTKDLSDEDIFVTPNCEPTSRRFNSELNALGFETSLIIMDLHKHVYIEAIVFINNLKRTIVIDPTYRQFYFAAVNLQDPHGKQAKKLSKIRRILPTRVLVVEAKDLGKVLNTGSALLPQWLVEFPMVGTISEYSEFYREYSL